MNKIKINIEICKQVAISRSGLCLSKNYINNYTKMNWICSKGHLWEASFSSVRNYNTWCSKCSNKNKKKRTTNLSINNCIELAKIKNGKCLSKEYTNAKIKLNWQCKDNHVWKSSYDSIKNGTWCPYCAKLAKLSIDDCYKIAKERGGVCLSKKYINCNSHLIWQCNNKHQWLASLSSLKHQNSWCPECIEGQNSSKGELEVLNFVKQYFPDANKIKNILPNKRMHLDVYIPSLNKAIEYDGRFHEFENQIKSDYKKDEYCKELNIELLRVNNKDYKKYKQKILNKIIQFLGITEVSI